MRTTTARYAGVRLERGHRSFCASIVQSPFRAYQRTAKLYSYLQIYSLVKDAEGKTKYTAVYDLIPRDPLVPEESIRLGETAREIPAPGDRHRP
jgi:hypothetical protein